ncbi:MAG: hypothetical protein M3O50_21365, partial [Myxococcota bacterium]|nr:hypothetical protein [Myxococcota bacterium]
MKIAVKRCRSVSLRIGCGCLLLVALGGAQWERIAQALSAPSASPQIAPTPAPPKPAPNMGDALDRQTPRRTLAGFIREAREGDFGVAASYMDLRGIP